MTRKYRTSDADARTVRAGHEVTYQETSKPKLPTLPKKVEAKLTSLLAAKRVKLVERKLTKYEVIIKRTIEHVATIEVEATSEDEAKQMAEAEADEPRSNHWREGDIISQDIKVKVSRG